MISKKYMTDEYINDLTEEMDKHILHPVPKLSWKTYIYAPSFNRSHYGIRYPGATRGSVVLDEDNIITNIILYDTAVGGVIGCYKDSVNEAVKQFIGRKLSFENIAEE